MVNCLEIDSIVKNYGSRIILSDIYLKCETGDIVGLFGRNGAGKSTLFRIIFGTESAEHKHLKINGEIHQKPYLTKNTIGYLPQFNFLPNNLTVKKAALLFLEITATDLFFTDPFIEKIVSNKINKLSGGELRYFEIKLILAQKSKFVILDEPFMGLSPIIIEEVKKNIIESSKTKGIIITDHSFANVLDISTKKYVIKEGRCDFFLNEEELIEYGYLSRNHSKIEY